MHAQPTLVDGLAPPDQDRAAALRRMKALATGLLAAMAVVFAVSFALEDTYPWLQYVRAASEGGMVGALADWFAVTALFKHPMGLKIPHTAIIPRRKDAIGASLGEFVGTNFLSEQVVERKPASLDIARKAGAWLARPARPAGPDGPAQPASAERVATEGAAAIRGAMTVLNDEAVQDVIESLARKHILAPQWGPPLGRLLERIFADGHHVKLVDLLVDRAAEWVGANQHVISRMVSDRSASWVPQFVDGLVGDKVYAEMNKFVQAVRQDPHHQVRRALDNYLQELARDMQHDPVMIARVESIKAQLLDDPRLQALAVRVWDTLKAVLLEAVDDPNSELRSQFTAAVREFGERLVTDEELAGKVNRWISDAAAYLVRTYRSSIAGVITETVERWDAEEASQKIELQVGRDLQFIRINGTVVGALAGLVIFALAHAVLG